MKYLKFFEDVYWGQDEPKVNHEYILNRLAEKFVDEQMGLDCAFFYVKYDGDVIEIGSRTTKGPNGEKRISELDPREWLECADDFIRELAKIGYKYEINGYNKRGFSVQKIEK